MAADVHRSIAVAVTGASGALYATRTIAALLASGSHVELIASDYGKRLLREELGEGAAVDRLIPYLVGRYGRDVEAGSLSVHSNRDLGAAIASGSHECSGMVIVPCSMKTLAGVAHGLSRNLIERAADVMLKERRTLVVVPRETPMSLPQLRNMVLCAEAGALILPAMPAFYQMPRTLDDLADFVAGKILSALGLGHTLYPPWTGGNVAPKARSEGTTKARNEPATKT
jgi:4-hydroxy-3-polyprenylbenzoate decarboxylase